MAARAISVERRLAAFFVCMACGVTPAFVAIARAEEPSPQEPKPAFENAPGWKWLLHPVEAHSSQVSGGVAVMVDRDATKALIAYVALGGDTFHQDYEYRLVVLDAARNRRELKPEQGGSGETVSLHRYRCDPMDLPADAVAKIGIEYLSPEGRPLWAEASTKKYRDLGVQFLPLPQIGHPYAFSLKTVAGETISADKLRGKVVLLDFWATWCSPCMRKMPDLKSLHERHKEAGLEVVGLSLDNDSAKAREAYKKLAISWPLHVIPADANSRAALRDVTGIQNIPRLILLDRNGVVRADLNGWSEHLVRQVETLTGDDRKGK
jgi:thiol-disulfide isomerase/thioredoxin